MKKCAGVWVDDNKAFMVFISPKKHGDEWDELMEEEGIETKKITSRQDPHNYEDIINQLTECKKLLILGPGEAKLGLKKAIEHQKRSSIKIADIKTVDKMTENQIVSKFRLSEEILYS